MRLIEILLEMLKEGTGNYISKYFFVEFGWRYRNSEEYNNLLSKLKKARKDGDYTKEEEELKKRMAKDFVEVAVSKMFPDADLSKLTTTPFKDLIIVTSKNQVSSIVKVEHVPKKIGGKEYYYIDPENSTIQYTDSDGEKLYLWNPPFGKQQYKKSPILSPTTSDKKRIYGAKEEKDKHKYTSKKQTTKELFRGKSDKKAEMLVDNSKNRMYVKEVEYAISQAKEAEKNGKEPEIDIAGDIDSKILKAYSRPRGGVENSDEKISEVCELLLKSIGSYCVSNGLVSDDSIEKKIVLNKDGEPVQNKQKLKMALGNIYVETVMNTKDYSIDRYNTKIVIQGIQVLPMEG